MVTLLSSLPCIAPLLMLSNKTAHHLAEIHTTKLMRVAFSLLGAVLLQALAHTWVTTVVTTVLVCLQTIYITVQLLVPSQHCILHALSRARPCLQALMINVKLDLAHLCQLGTIVDPTKSVEMLKLYSDVKALSQQEENTVRMAVKLLLLDRMTIASRRKAKCMDYEA